jgi:hypothetical protein
LKNNQKHIPFFTIFHHVRLNSQAAVAMTFARFLPELAAACLKEAVILIPLH